MFTEQQIAVFHTRYKKDKKTGCWNWTGAKMTGGYGYCSVTHLHNGIKKRCIGAHRFSYIIHNGMYYPERKELVTHRCDNPSCVNPDHLVLGTTQSNTQEAVDRGLLINVKGEKHGRAKLTVAKVKQIKKLISEGWNDNRLGKKFGVSGATIFCIRIGRNWKHVKI